MSARTAVFLVVVVVFLGMTALSAARNRTASAHYVASGRVPGWLNGLAMTGEYASAASFLGITGGIALSGYGGFYLAVGTPLGVLLLLLLVAEPMRRKGTFTLADMLATRFDSTALRALVAVLTIVLTVMYMLAQFVGAGALLSRLFGFGYVASVCLVGVLMVVIVMVGGMAAATHVQAFKTVILLGITAALVVLVLSRTGWSPLALMAAAVGRYGRSAVTSQSPVTLAGRLDTLSVPLALALGAAGLPHMMIRFLTVRSVRAARRSALLTCWIMAVYLVGIVVVGYGAAVLVGRDAIAAANPAGTLAALQIADLLGGGVFEAVAAGATLAIIVAVLCGLTVAASGAVAHDLYTNVLRGGAVSHRGQLVAARVGSLVVALVGLLLALEARTINLAFLGSLAFCVAASTTLPVILLTIYWPRFTATGAVAALLVGLVSSVVTIALGPNLMGGHAVFPLAQPLLVTAPLGFLAAVVGSLVGPSPRPRAVPTASPVAVTEAG